MSLEACFTEETSCLGSLLSWWAWCPREGHCPLHRLGKRAPAWGSWSRLLRAAPLSPPQAAGPVSCPAVGPAQWPLAALLTLSWIWNEGGAAHTTDAPVGSHTAEEPEATAPPGSALALSRPSAPARPAPCSSAALRPRPWPRPCPRPCVPVGSREAPPSLRHVPLRRLPSVGLGSVGPRPWHAARTAAPNLPGCVQAACPKE